MAAPVSGNPFQAQDVSASLPGTLTPGLPAPSEAPFIGRPYDPEKDREWIRGAVTVASLLLFAALVVIYLIAAFKVTNDAQWARIKDATQVILPAVTSILGSALGFYFGSQKR